MAPSKKWKQGKWGKNNEAFSADNDDQLSVSNSEKEDKSAQEDDQIDVLAPVSFFHLFRFASKTDVFLMILSTLAAVGTGLCFPVMLILFGDVTNSFVGGGLDPDTMFNIRCNESFANMTFPNST